MYLIYINELGKDYKGQNQYEFIFGKDKLVEPLDQRIDVSNRQVWDYQN